MGVYREKLWNTVIFLLFFILISVFFGNSVIRGKVINGIDGNYAYRHVEKQQLEDSGLVDWSPQSWLGQKRIFHTETKYLFRKMFSMRWELFANLSFVIFMASVFTYLLLRRLKLGHVPAAFGAIAYAFAPHYISLIYPCHIGPLNSIGYTPASIYFLTIAFDDPTLRSCRHWAATLLAGLALAMAISDDPQRGMYIIAMAGAYVVFRLWVSISSSGQGLPSKRLLRALGRALLIAMVFLLTFYHNFRTQMGGKNVEGGPVAAESDQGGRSEEKWEFSTSWSLNPEELADSLAPGYHGSISGDPDQPYWGARPVAHSSDSLGFFVLVFGLLGAAVGFRRNRYVRFFLIAAIIATLLSFGRYWPGKPLFWLWYQLPMMDKFRAPSKFMCVTAFSMSILAGFGLHYLIGSLRENTRLAGRFQKLLLVLLAVGAVWFLALIGNESVFRSELLSGKFGGDEELAKTALSNALLAVTRMNLYILISIIVLSLARRFRDFPYRVEISAYLFALFLVFDLFSIDQFYLQKSLFDPAEFFVEDEVIQAVKSGGGSHRVTTNLKVDYQGRMVPLSLTAVGNYYTTYFFPYFQVDSFDSPPSSRVAKDYGSFFTGMLAGFPRTQDPGILARELIDNNIRIWRLCNVRYLISDGNLHGPFRRPIPIMDALENHPGLSFVGAAKGFAGREQAIFEIRGALPRFAFYGDFMTVDNADKSLEVLSSPGFDVDRQVVVEDMPKTLAAAEKTHYAEPEILEEENGYAKLGVDAPGAGILLMNSRYDEGWKAYIDGSPTDTLRANFIMTAVPLPAGEHIVEFRFEPSRATLRISITAIIFVIFASVVAVSVCSVKNLCGRRVEVRQS